MIRNELKKILSEKFPEESIAIDYVPEGKTGDYSTNLAMRIASRKSESPMKVAEEIVKDIKNPAIKDVAIYPPGFINFVLAPDYILKKFKDMKEPDLGKGQRVNVEFVSVNPTGPINIVNGRAAAFGDSLVRLLNYAGFQADAEYYINDTGRQIELLAESVRQRMNQIENKEFSIPDDGYHGEYLIPLAEEFLKKGIVNLKDIGPAAVNHFVEEHKKVLENFRVSFKNWIRESDIRKGGYIDRVLKSFEDKKILYELDGARYLNTKKFDDDRDRVIITKDGRYTYLLPDIAYHLNKIERNYEKLITILGPDHLGQIKSLYAGLNALGYKKEMLKIIIVQEVKLKKEGRYISMSKRAGTFTPLEDLLQDVGIDVVRFFFLMRSSSQHLDFDIDLAKKVSEENPVYYVQYAYARIMSIIKYAKEKGLDFDGGEDLNLLKEKEEFDLIKHILRFAEIIEDAVKNLEPFMITYSLIDLARLFHYFYQKHRVVGEDKKISRARLFLVSRTAETIKKGMEILGCYCPERM